MGNRKKTTIKITLKSDLCVSTGHAFAGVIDTDVCADGNGFPYIPAKRLKGVMRQAADLICTKEEINRIFGEGGISGHNGFYLGDAMMCDMEEIGREISAIKKTDKHSSLTTQNVLKLFTAVRAQTKLDENGVADENTLRYTRVVNQYLPKCISSDQKEVSFEAPIEYDESDQTRLENIVKVVRHIGMDRNRGLGNIRCEMDVQHAEELVSHEKSLEPSGNSCEKVVIDYTVQNMDQLMLSASKDDVTEDYISGQTVLGALAGAYLRAKGKKEPDEVFRAIFLSGKSVFSNLYITDSVGKQYFPAPLFVNMLKKSKKYVCTVKSFDDEEWESSQDSADYDPSDGNQPKKLVGKYISIQDGKISVLEPDTDIIYHHSRAEVYDEGRMGEDKSKGILYSMEVLEKDQLFSGSITVEERYAGIIKTLLNATELRFGKSKSAQYGRCKVVHAEKVDRCPEQSMLEGKGRKVLVVFQSDAIIPGKLGYTVRCDEVQDYIAKQLGLSIPDSAKVYMNIKTVTGYNAKINLKRSSVPAICAGSALEFETYKDICSDGRLGSFVSEGFGQFHVVDEQDLSYVLNEAKNENKAIAGAENAANGVQISDKCKRIQGEVEKQLKFDSLKANFIDNYTPQLNISSALVGRITLMLQESRNAEDTLIDFAERVVSIKRTKERENVIEKLSDWKICRITTKTKKDEDGQLLLDKAELLMTDPDLKALWADYLAFILLHVKYYKSSQKKQTADREEGEENV